MNEMIVLRRTSALNKRLLFSFSSLTYRLSSIVLRPSSFVKLTLVLMLLSSPVFAQESFEFAEQKAQEAHELAGSDVIYQQADFKALYYQNIQIIQILKEIHEEIKIANARLAKDVKN